MGRLWNLKKGVRFLKLGGAFILVEFEDKEGGREGVEKGSETFQGEGAASREVVSGSRLLQSECTCQRSLGEYGRPSFTLLEVGGV